MAVLHVSTWRSGDFYVSISTGASLPRATRRGNERNAVSPIYRLDGPRVSDLGGLLREHCVVCGKSLSRAQQGTELGDFSVFLSYCHLCYRCVAHQETTPQI